MMSPVWLSTQAAMQASYPGYLSYDSSTGTCFFLAKTAARRVETPVSSRRPGSTATLRIRDNRKIPYRKLDQLIRAMWSVRIEKQAVTGAQMETLIAMPISDLTFEYVKEFDTLVLKGGKGIGFLGQADEIRFDHDAAAVGVEMS